MDLRKVGLAVILAGAGISLDMENPGVGLVATGVVMLVIAGVSWTYEKMCFCRS